MVNPTFQDVMKSEVYHREIGNRTRVTTGSSYTDDGSHHVHIRTHTNREAERESQTELICFRILKKFFNLKNFFKLTVTIQLFFQIMKTLMNQRVSNLRIFLS